MTRINRHIHAVPTPMGGLALATASLSSAWSMLLPSHSMILKSVLCGIAGAALLLLWSKLLFAPHVRQEELQHHIVGSVMPTICMATMVVAAALLPLSSALAKVLWLSSIVIHVALALRFFYHQIHGFKLSQVMPSWFIPPVGIVVATVTAPGMGFDLLAKALFWLGLASYWFLLPVVAYRLLFAARPLPNTLPTIAVLGAPASLCLAGYLALFQSPNIALVCVLAGLAVMMTALIYLAMFKLLRLEFSPAYSAFTFPMVIGASALLLLEQRYGTALPVALSDMVYVLARIELALASSMVGYVVIRYLRHYAQILNQKTLKVSAGEQSL
ncbi:TDT family transporter [Echinimonas agarilytica]|uniref:TDT family transporter n=1 Tax=Echinimonas agarilytica TaxID=1215918 RepID=A0AA41W5S3_9GAMM|nr:TDT family transporter [Echinimonas agarilytica]MCM2679392.1 TDT family transporter [Echinimonas agarilytica]